ncbi:MAG: (Fe-S)-binding protein [Candidatus Latescibacterota bacterium]
MSTALRYDLVARCNRCGFCQTACPVFRATGREAGVARGRIALLRALIEGRLEWTSELEGPLFDCLRCGACTAHCFPAVATADLVADARAEYLERLGRSRLHRLLLRRLLPHPTRVRRVARLVALGKSSGLSRAARALGMLRGFGRDLARAEGIVERLPEPAYRATDWSAPLAGYGPDLRIGYFVGCGMDVLCPRAAGASVGLLRRLGRSVQVLDNCCCGLPATTYGDRQAACDLAARNLQRIDAEALDVVVTDCSSCASYLKHYPELFAADNPRAEAARRLSSRVRDLLELLPALHGDGSAGLAAAPPRRPRIVTYHDPCHAARGQQLVKEPRQALRGVPGLEYRELPEADWCCGGAGAYALSHFDLSLRVLDRKIDNVARTGADLLVTACPACVVQLSYGIRRRGLPIEVCHISQVLADSTPSTPWP